MMVGVDYGTRKVALAALPPKGGGAAPVVFSHFCTPRRCRTANGTVVDKAQHLSDMVALWLLDINADSDGVTGLAVVEMPYMGLSRATAMNMAVVAGHICAMVKVAAPGLDVALDAPSLWRSRIMAGRTGKQEVMEWLAEKHPEASWENDDEADALGMAYSAEALSPN